MDASDGEPALSALTGDDSRVVGKLLIGNWQTTRVLPGESSRASGEMLTSFRRKRLQGVEIGWLQRRTTFLCPSM